MKPTKNRCYCSACKRTKMLFETQAKADNFIKFNSTEILEETGHAPIRSYYCIFCMGWHVTSISSIEHGELLDEKDSAIVNSFIDKKKKANNLRKEIDNYTISTKLAIYDGKYDSQMKTGLDMCYHLYEQYRKEGINPNSFMKISRNIDFVSELINYIVEINDLSTYSLESRLKDYIVEKHIDKYKIRYLYSRFIDLSFSEIEDIKDLSVIEIELTRRIDIIDNKCCFDLKHRFYKKRDNYIEKCYNKQNKTRIANKTQTVSKEKLLELIKYLEDINTEFSNNNVLRCADLVDVGYIILDELPSDDENVIMLRQHFDNWKIRLE